MYVCGPASLQFYFEIVDKQVINRQIISWSTLIGRVNDYPTMHYFGIPTHTQSMIAYKILTEYCWKFQWEIALWECC